MDNIFPQFTIILLFSSFPGYLVLKLKPPLMVAYLLTEVLLSPVTFFNPAGSFFFDTLPNIGIAFVLFLIGMELDLKEINAFGKPILIFEV